MNRLDDLNTKLFIWVYDLKQARLWQGLISNNPNERECLNMIIQLQKEIDYQIGANGNGQLGHTEV